MTQPIRITIKTQDGLSLAAKYWPGTIPAGAVLVHARPETKEIYDHFAALLCSHGLHVLAFDLRGHGESAGGDYNSFTDADHQKSILDVSAAVSYLSLQDSRMKIGLVGGSIGGNLALQYAAEHGAAFVATLSAGLNYRGVDGLAAVARLSANLPVLFVSAEDDANVPDNAEMALALFEACASADKDIKIYNSGGHAGSLLNVPELPKLLLNWILHHSAN